MRDAGCVSALLSTDNNGVCMRMQFRPDKGWKDAADLVYLRLLVAKSTSSDEHLLKRLNLKRIGTFLHVFDNSIQLTVCHHTVANPASPALSSKPAKAAAESKKSAEPLAKRQKTSAEIRESKALADEDGDNVADHKTKPKPEPVTAKDKVGEVCSIQ